MKDSLLWTDCRRCLISVRFLITIFAIAAVCLAGRFETIEMLIKSRGMDDWLSSLREIEWLLTFDRYKCVMTAALAALYAGSFTQDRKNNYLRCLLSRISLRRYVVCRLLVLLFGCVIATVAGFGLTALILSPWMGIRVVEGNIVAMRFYSLASGRFAILYLILLGVNFGMSAAVAAVLGMWMTVFRKEQFLAVGGSVLAFYFLYAVSIPLPDVFSYSVIGSRFNQAEIASDTGVILYHVGFLGFMFAAAGILFYITVKRRWKRGQLV